MPNQKPPSLRGNPLIGEGGELHQSTEHNVLTTNQGVPVSDNQNSLRLGSRGPTFLEDFLLREKISHFDHERIPERIVHARGSGAHGYFEAFDSFAKYTRAAFLQNRGQRTPVFVRFSTAVGGAGSIDLPRDARGFAVKFYTSEGNFDLVGNNIPVFFIQDAVKFPDLIHSLKMEPDRAFPQATSAHDTFWDFMSLMPESAHMVMWLMSDRALPRSYRMMEGFGVHTFRLINARGEPTFVKFHWRPKLGMQSVLWEEASKISGVDPDFHRRDLWKAIDAGDFPEWELCFQLFTEEESKSFPVDILDPTKLIPEEVVPLTRVGRMVLDRNPDNFFAETEQIAFCPANIVPGIDFTDDPLLQGRLFSYLDSQHLRLGGPNFQQLPINAARCPVKNFHRDGFMQMNIPKGRVNYEPNSLGADSPRENPSVGFQSFQRQKSGAALRVRSESFADHYTQARLFWLSQTSPEQNHIVAALIFELSKVETPDIRSRVVGHLLQVDESLGERVATGLKLGTLPNPAPTQILAARNVTPSPSLSLLKKAIPTLKGRSLGCLVTDGADAALLDQLQLATATEGAKLTLIAPRIGVVSINGGRQIPIEAMLSAAPSVLFDAVLLCLSPEGANLLLKEASAIEFVRDAFCHLKLIGFSEAAEPLLQEAGLKGNKRDPGLVLLREHASVLAFMEQAKRGRIWEREPKVKTVY